VGSGGGSSNVPHDFRAELGLRQAGGRRLPGGIETMLRAVASSKASLSSVLVARLGHWTDRYAGNSAEPRLRQYLSRIESHTGQPPPTP
jgi:hypothetical protein